MKKRKLSVRKGKKKSVIASGETGKGTENVIDQVVGTAVVMIEMIATETEFRIETGIATETGDVIRRTKIIGGHELHRKDHAPHLDHRLSQAHRPEEVDLETEPKWRLARHVEQKKII
jgi:hypothetical protein